MKEDHSLPENNCEIKWVDGMPCIVLPPGSITIKRPRPRMGVMEFHIVDLRKMPKDFTELQRKKETTFLDKIMKELDEFFKGWF